MKYEINIAQDGRHYGLIVLPVMGDAEAESRFREFVTLFPAKDGWGLTLTRSYTMRETLNEA